MYDILSEKSKLQINIWKIFLLIKMGKILYSCSRLSMFIFEHWKDVERICWLPMGMGLKMGGRY